MAKNMEATNAPDGNYLGEETLITEEGELFSLEKDVSKQDIVCGRQSCPRKRKS